MIIFFDTEFTGLHRDAQLISIGMVAQNGRKFYGEFTDYEIDHRLDKWVKDNVIIHTTSFDEDFKYQIKSDKNTVFVVGPERHIRYALSDWLEHFGEPIQLISDVCHYDMVLFCDLFGGAFHIPKCVNPVCHDICQDIARYARIIKEKHEGSIADGKPPYISISVSIDLPYPVDETIRVVPNQSVVFNRLVNSNYCDYVSLKMEAAFDISREILCKGLTGTLPNGYKHNSLYDAEVIKSIYEVINK